MILAAILFLAALQAISFFCIFLWLEEIKARIIEANPDDEDFL